MPRNTQRLRPSPGAPRDLRRQSLADQQALKDRALAATSEGITISDARLPDIPIIYANAGFERLTGYPIPEILGRNHRLLQGPDTDPETIEEVRRSIAAERACRVEILNYRRDGTAFWNLLSITPVRDEAGAVTHFIGVQSDITRSKQTELALREAKAALENAQQRSERDLELAARVQRSLLPAHGPDIPGVRAAWRFRPCESLAGDTLNVRRLDDRRLGLYVVDVSGHGLAAALLSVTLSHWLGAGPEASCLFSRRGSRFEIAPPAQVAARLNEHFPMNLKTGLYFTLAYVVLDVESGVATAVSAGHPPAIHLPAGRPARHMTRVGYPIGMVPDCEPVEESVTLGAGDRLFLYTDGMIEARDTDGQELGCRRLVETLESHRGADLETLLDAALERVEGWCPEGRLTDDVSLLAVEMEG